VLPVDGILTHNWPPSHFWLTELSASHPEPDIAAFTVHHLHL